MSFCKWYVIAHEMPAITKYPVRKNGEKVWTGTIEIYFTAPDPNASFIDMHAETGTPAYQETGLIPLSADPADPSVTGEEFYVFNPGNVRCGLSIRIAGNAGTEGVTFANVTNGQTCTVKGITKATTSNAYKWLDVEGKTMRTFLRGAATEAYGYEFHDDGYIWLEPCTPFEKDFDVRVSSNYLISDDGMFRPCMEGQYVFMQDKWYKINKYIDSTRLQLDSALRVKVLGEFILGMDAIGEKGLESAEGMIVIATLNKIRINKSSGTDLTRLEVSYEPKLRVR